MRLIGQFVDRIGTGQWPPYQLQRGRNSMRTFITFTPPTSVFMPLRSVAALTFLLGTLGASGPVRAANGDHVIIGLGAASMPSYKGSDESKTKAVPLVNVQKGRFFVRSDAGIGMNLYEDSHFTVGVSVNKMAGYDEEDAPAGIGEVKDALGGRVFVTTRFGGAVGTFSATQSLSEKERGLQLDARVSYPWRATDRLTIVPSFAISAGNAEYMNSYFGINAERSVRSGLPQYQMNGGVKEVSLSILANYKITDRWAVTGGLVTSQLLGDAGDSPIVKRKSSATGILGLTYAF
jgi:MipA family protein